MDAEAGPGGVSRVPLQSSGPRGGRSSMVERQVVALEVVGSSPIALPLRAVSSVG